MAARNKDKAEGAIRQIESAAAKKDKGGQQQARTGSLKYLPIDLNDLRTVKPFVEAFLAAETRLDLLYNNAGVANVPPSRRTAQGLETHLGVNCVGHYLLTQLLAPILVATAKDPNTPPNSVRVIWSSSMLVDALAPPEGVPPGELDKPHRDQDRNYAISKAGNWFLAARLAKQLGPEGVVSITQNPGNLVTPIWKETNRLVYYAVRPVLYKTVRGTQTLLWAGLSQDITVADGGRYVIPWGRWHPNPRKELLEAIKDEDEGGKGYARGFEEWCKKVSDEFR